MNIPNLITIARFFFIPLYFVLFFSDLALANLYAFLIIILAGLSDILDGYLARKNNQITDLGQLLDPLADKLMMLAVILSFVIDNRISWLAAGVFFFRDIAMIVASAFFHLKKYKILAANVLGKATTVFFYFAFVLLMFQLPYGQEVLWAAILFSFVSSIVYTKNFMKAKKEFEADKKSEEAV